MSDIRYLIATGTRSGVAVVPAAFSLYLSTVINNVLLDAADSAR